MLCFSGNRQRSTLFEIHAFESAIARPNLEPLEPPGLNSTTLWMPQPKAVAAARSANAAGGRADTAAAQTRATGPRPARSATPTARRQSAGAKPRARSVGQDADGDGAPQTGARSDRRQKLSQLDAARATKISDVPIPPTLAGPAPDDSMAGLSASVDPFLGAPGVHAAQCADAACLKADHTTCSGHIAAHCADLCPDLSPDLSPARCRFYSTAGNHGVQCRTLSDVLRSRPRRLPRIHRRTRRRELPHKVPSALPPLHWRSLRLRRSCG